jgi:phage antirepressor YoqD-like protein
MGLKITNSQINIIDSATLKEFEDELKSLINEIMDPKVDFIDSQS